MLYDSRSDMASELYTRLSDASSLASVPGLDCRHEQLFSLDVLSLRISAQEASAALGCRFGQYYTLTLPEYAPFGGEEFANACSALSTIISRCLPSGCRSFLIACLGNPNMTPDAVGALAAENILVTRHLRQNGSNAFSSLSSVALCRPGVLASSGLESAFQISLLCSKLHPDCLIVIDALAGADPDGLCRRVQVSDAGIAPGSGVGNDRQELSSETMGVPVISIGVPTVIDCAALGCEELKGMFVTPIAIDSLVKAASKTVAYGLNMALHPNLSFDDILFLRND